MSEPYEDGGEINHLIHEGRAKKRGLTWNREKYRFEKDGVPGFFMADGSFYPTDEEEWQQHINKVEEWEKTPFRRYRRKP